MNNSIKMALEALKSCAGGESDNDPMSFDGYKVNKAIAALQHDGGQEPEYRNLLINGLTYRIGFLPNGKSSVVQMQSAKPDSNVIADTTGSGAFTDSDVIDTPAVAQEHVMRHIGPPAEIKPIGTHIGNPAEAVPLSDQQEAALQELADLGQEMGIGYDSPQVKESEREEICFSYLTFSDITTAQELIDFLTEHAKPDSKIVMLCEQDMNLHVDDVLQITSASYDSADNTVDLEFMAPTKGQA